MGVDQVLQVEMVLPNGYHVKFGPTEWEDASAEGFATPRSKVVSGVCRSNPDEQDEEKWMWGDCPADFDIDFGDLWFAVRGGGGGTYGVVTSMSIQLQDYLPYNMYGFAWWFEECSAFSPKFQEFQAKYFMAPSLLNVTMERSLACGSSDAPYFHCYGEEDVMQAWTNFLELSNSTSTEALACFYHAYDASSDESPRSYPEAELMDENSRFPGKVRDGPSPSLFTVPPGSAFVLIPQSWIDASEKNIDILVENTPLGAGGSYYAYGVGTSRISDQANSLPRSLRDAAVMTNQLITSDYFWSDLFPKMYDISDKTKFPAVVQSNHAGPLLTGPLKDDWTKPCPQEWTWEKKKEKCISGQEAIYGTEVLSRLEAIKLAVDPGFMFKCHGCIGDNLDLSKTPEAEAEVPPVEPAPAADKPSSASFASTYAYAVAISATVLYFFLSLS